MRTVLRTLLQLGVVAALAAAMVWGQNSTPSSKATYAINTAVGCTASQNGSTSTTSILYDCHDIFTGATITPDANNFVTIMTATVKVSNSESLFVSPSLVTGLYTDTKVKTSTGSTSTATAMGGVYLTADLVDSSGNVIYADPVDDCATEILGCQQVTGGSGNEWGVTLDSRIQTLTQTLSDCVVSTGGSCNFSSTIDLLLNTTSAHTFNFIFANVGVGVYTLEIKAAVNSNATATSGSSAIAGAAFGLGSVTADVVRLLQGSNSFSF